MRMGEASFYAIPRKIVREKFMEAPRAVEVFTYARTHMRNCNYWLILSECGRISTLELPINS